MKIVDYKTYAVNAAYRNLIFVKVFTDQDGLYGVGEATIEWKTNATLGAFEDLRPYIIGSDPRRYEWLFFDSSASLIGTLTPVPYLQSQQLKWPV